MNWFNNIISYIKNLIIGVFIRISLSLSKTENVLLKNTHDNDHSGDGNEIKNIQNDILRSLYNGEYNKEYVEKFYKILKLADEKIYKVDFSKIDSKRTDSTEDFKLIDIINNIIEIKNHDEVVFSNKEPVKLTRIKSKDLDRKYKIEEFTEYLHIKKYDNEHLLLEFYINKYNYNNIDNYLEDFKNISNIYYNSKYGELTEYKIIKFYKLSIYNFNHVLKFIAKKI
jgi:hypothetical protein